jgi:23S rRNA (adenine2503-C2)-methyltransferase
MIGKSLAIFYAEILDLETADGSGHPAVLVAMIVDAGELADFPADGHTFEEVVLENEIAGVAALGEIEVFAEGFGANVMARDELLHAFKREVFGGDSGEIFYPVGNGELFDGEIIGHEGPPRNYSSGKVLDRSDSESDRLSRVNGLRQGPSAAWPRAQRPRTRKCEATPVGMTAFCCDGEIIVEGDPEEMELLGKSREELREWLAGLGEPAYRGDQIYRALYQERNFEIAKMTALPAALREKLAREATITLPSVRHRYFSKDGSVRYLFGLGAEEERKDNAETQSPQRNAEERERPSLEKRPASVEAVWMPSENRQTICISTQAGCAVDCQFCMTAQLGLIRNLTPGEIAGQILVALRENEEEKDYAETQSTQRNTEKKQTNVVLMGQGEPLLNYENVMAAMRIVLDPKGVGLAPKHVTLSTSGIVPGIEKLAKEAVRPKLAISLNASNDEQRDLLMPINKKYPLAELLAACKRFPTGSREYITFEYVLLGGVNDTAEDARRVAQLMSGLGRVKVNLIPWNPGALPYKEPTEVAIAEFHRILLEKDVPAFTRYSRGRDVMAACGQLALGEMKSPQSSVISIQ